MYTHNQLDAVVDLLGAETVIKHILGQRYSSKVLAAMELSFSTNGNLTKNEIDIINQTVEIEI